MPRGSEPLYQQVADQLRRQIADGHYAIGALLPSEEELCQQFAVSRITIRAALAQLVEAHLLRRQRGKGTVVTTPPVEHQLIRLTDFVEDMTAAGLQATSRVLHLGEEPASATIAQALQIRAGIMVVRLDRLRFADGSPIAFDVSFLPLRYGHLLDHTQLAEETIYQQLERRYGIAIDAGTFIVEADDASESVADALALPRGAAVLLVHRTARTDRGDVVFYQQRWYRADRVRFRLELHRNAANGRSQLTEFSPLFALVPAGDAVRGA